MLRLKAAVNHIVVQRNGCLLHEALLFESHLWLLVVSLAGGYLSEYQCDHVIITTTTKLNANSQHQPSTLTQLASGSRHSAVASLPPSISPLLQTTSRTMLRRIFLDPVT